ncbi:S-layer family protein [Nostoc sp. CHAB 5784]|uniref:two-partner secretion domain-containing protein n=1 Tax=Nostoc mirabile TaxID=2907820 RepID=UPI001E441F66|nr:S-layer family protein [Nostoc mirabile]MCC5670307.1 S-layer family protein [Nostoc mirabile CHAB5784]
MATWKNRNWRSGLLGVFGIIAVLAHVIFCFENHALAQIIPDETLDDKSSRITPNVNIKGSVADRIDGGATLGANLFHSFREFNVGDGQRVYFSNPTGINNILGRVTGNDPSDILGTLGVNGNANLFLINPNEIIFGQNARLDVGKSFYVTTANSIKFGELGEFSATNPQLPSSLLTINPSAFFFNLGTNPGSIINQSRATQTVQGTPTDGLQVPNGQTLLLLGGNVTVDDGRLIARGGRVEIGAVAGTGSVGLNANGSLSFPDTIQRANVVFKNQASANRSGIDVRSGNGGDVGITAGNIDLYSGSQLRVGIASGLGTLESRGGELIVNATGEVRMTGEDTRMANDIRPNAIGKAGNIQVTARSLVVTNGAQLSASTFGVGDAGNVTITANNISLNGTRADERGVSAIFSRVEQTSSGKGGDVQIFANTLDVTGGAALVTSTEGTGDAGNILIVARDRVSFDGISFGKQFSSSAFSNVLPTATGKGGNVQIFTNTLDVTNGAQIVSATFGSGDAGNILVNAVNAVNITKTTPLTGRSSGFFTTTGNFSIGNGGDIIINTKTFHLIDGAVLDSSTNSSDRSGNITINAETIGILNGGQILAITNGKGRAGNITVNATQKVTLAGSDSTFGNRLAEFPDAVAPLTPNSGIFVRSQASGGAGEITITSPQIRLEQGILSAESTTVDGGNVILNARDILLLRNRSLISATAGTAQQNGDGGNITINAPKGFIVAVPKENSDIKANAYTGKGGIVDITANGIFGIVPQKDPTEKSDITASSELGVSGEVTINIPDTDPARGLIQLPSNLVDASQQIASGCTPGGRQTASRFIATGRGGLPLSPNEPLRGRAVITGWVDLPPLATAITDKLSTATVTRSADQIVEAQGWIVDANGDVILIAQSLQSSSIPSAISCSQ